MINITKNIDEILIKYYYVAVREFVLENERFSFKAVTALSITKGSK